MPTVLRDHVDDAGNDECDRDVDRNGHIHLRMFGQNGYAGKIGRPDDPAARILFDMFQSRVRHAAPNSVSTSGFRIRPGLRSRGRSVQNASELYVMSAVRSTLSPLALPRRGIFRR
ncbi:hypothetical protein GCM10027089_08100 [Nocardia thraciensis]